MNAVLVFAFCVPYVVASGAETNSSIEELRQGRYVGQERLSSIVASLRASDGARGLVLWEKLKPVVTDKRAHLLVRSELLALACEKSDGATNDILALGEHWLAEIESARNKAEPPDNRLTETESLLYRLVSDGYQQLNFDANTSARAFSLLRRAVLGIWAGENLEPCFKALRRLSVSTEARRQLVLEVISSGRACSDFALLPPNLVAMVDDPAILEVRRFIRLEADPGASLNWCAAKVLAHLGDEPSLPELAKWREKIPAKDEVSRGYLELLLSQIRLQHPTSRLIEFVRGQGEPDTSDGTLVGWAILRACELGVPKDEVRAAILFRASELETSSEPRKHIERWLLKQTGDKTGVLAREDLAGVKPFATSNPGTNGKKD